MKLKNSNGFLKKRLKLILGILALPVIIYAQQNDQKLPTNELDQQYIPNKNSILNSGKDGLESSKNRDDISIKNAIQFNPGLLIRKQFALFYERGLNSNISLQAGLGTVFGIDPIMAVVSQVDINTSNTPSAGVGGNSNVINLSQILQSASIQQGANPFISVNFKFYTGTYGGIWSNFGYGNNRTNYSEAFEGGYFQLGIRFYSMNVIMDAQTFNNTNSDYYLATNTSVNVRSTYYTMTYGRQITTSGKLKTTHDFYAGAGVRVSSYDGFDTRTETVQTGNIYNPTATENVLFKSSTRQGGYFFAFLFGYVFGFGF